jgi:glycosyltransferase involved in cell wall biosynthesis
LADPANRVRIGTVLTRRVVGGGGWQAAVHCAASDGRTGLVIRKRDPASIAAALVRLLANPRLARRLSEAGRVHVACHFSMARMAAAYQRLFAELCRTC